MLKAFQEHINHNLKFLTSGKLLIAISGGLDSVVLTNLCHKSNFKIALAHCNFNLRGEESDSDESFVIELADTLNLEVFSQHFDTDTFANEQGISTQMAARDLRYDWFKNLAKQLDFDYILTAHHADDALETFLINLSRGTGLDGLSGIPQINENIVRPLLPFTREDIENYATANQLKWREDSSNASLKYLRNQLRHEVIPALKSTNPKFLQNFQNTQAHLKDSQLIVNNTIDQFIKDSVEMEGDTLKIDIASIKGLSNRNAYLFALLKDYNFTAWDDIVNLIDAQSGKQILSSTHVLLKDRTYLILSELNKRVSSSVVERLSVNENTKKCTTILGTLAFDDVNQIAEINDSTVYVDKDLLKYPLTVRHWKKGDYFYPFGMQSRKKLSKFFKDEKYTLNQKESALLLYSDNDIVWIINKRADDRFKVHSTTNNILKITVK